MNRGRRAYRNDLAVINQRYSRGDLQRPVEVVGDDDGSRAEGLGHSSVQADLTDPAARKKMYPEMVRFFQEEGSLVIFSNEIQRYWMKPNVQGSVALSSLELRFEDTWLG